MTYSGILRNFRGSSCLGEFGSRSPLNHSSCPHTKDFGDKGAFTKAQNGFGSGAMHSDAEMDCWSQDQRSLMTSGPRQAGRGLSLHQSLALFMRCQTPPQQMPPSVLKILGVDQPSHRKSGRFANFVREPGFSLNSPSFSREKPPNSREKWGFINLVVLDDLLSCDGGPGS